MAAFALPVRQLTINVRLINRLATSLCVFFHDFEKLVAS